MAENGYFAVHVFSIGTSLSLGTSLLVVYYNVMEGSFVKRTLSKYGHEASYRLHVMFKHERRASEVRASWMAVVGSGGARVHA